MKITRFLSRYLPLSCLSVPLLLAGLILIPDTVEADAVTSYTFSGDLTGGGVVTGTFSLDATNDTISAFNFSTPNGSVTSTNWTPSITAFTPYSPATNVLQLAFSDASSGGLLQLFFETTPTTFSASTPLYTMSVEPGYLSTATESLFYCGTACTVGSEFTSGTASPISAAEPSSLVLLGIGLIGFAPLLRRRSG
jgi:PEP-CTERM motif